MTRSVELLQVPTGRGLLGIIPGLRDALAGAGPALAPVAAGDQARIQLLTRAFGVGRPLADGEDDPGDPTVIVIATSGSTGVPKGTLLSRSALAASAAATQHRLGPPGSWLLALPAEHIAGLQVVLRSIAIGTSLHLIDTGLPFTVERFVAATGTLPPGPRYLSLVPTQLYRLLDDAAGSAALRSFTSVLVGGAATAPALVAGARAAEINIVTTYGMSETCGGCVYDGVPLDGVRATLEPDGRIVLGGPVVGRGYRNLPGHPAFGEGRTFRTDDVGEWIDGRLRIIGRIDDIIVTGGLKVAPGRLEDAIAHLKSVAAVVVVGIADPEWGQRIAAVVVPARATDPPTLSDLRGACDDAGIARALHPRTLTLAAQLPVRGPGKPDRIAAAALARRQTGRRE